MRRATAAAFEGRGGENLCCAGVGAGGEYSATGDGYLEWVQGELRTGIFRATDGAGPGGAMDGATIPDKRPGPDDRRNPAFRMASGAAAGQ